VVVAADARVKQAPRFGIGSDDLFVRRMRQRSMSLQSTVDRLANLSESDLPFEKQPDGNVIGSAQGHWNSSPGGSRGKREIEARVATAIEWCKGQATDLFEPKTWPGSKSPMGVG
jgi:hypothetical protein